MIYWFIFILYHGVGPLTLWHRTTQYLPESQSNTWLPLLQCWTSFLYREWDINCMVVFYEAAQIIPTHLVCGTYYHILLSHFLHPGVSRISFFDFFFTVHGCLSKYSAIKYCIILLLWYKIWQPDHCNNLAVFLPI